MGKSRSKTRKGKESFLTSSDSSSSSSDSHKMKREKKIKKEKKKEKEKYKRREKDSDKKEKKHKKNRKESKKKSEEEVEKEKPNFTPSGILAKYSAANIGGFVLKFTVPLDAKYPTDNWKLFPFKENESYQPINLYGKTAFLVGREEQICDVHLQNPSISSQHAVIQFRAIRKVKEEESGMEVIVKPYLMDLESTNGTRLNHEAVESARYYELKDQDVLQFGTSTREFVLIRE